MKNAHIFAALLVIAGAGSLYLIPSIYSEAGGVSMYKVKPKITENYVTGIAPTSAAVNFRTDITAHGRVCYSATNKRVGSDAPCASTTGYQNTFHTVGIGDLTPATTYYYRIYVRHTAMSAYTESQPATFTTLAQ